MNDDRSYIGKPALRWEIFGMVFIILLGGMLHFVYEWSGESAPVALIAAVNESVWEHLKLAFWPGFLWFLIEWGTLKRFVNNFFFAKAFGILLMPLAITVLFYGYTAFVEDALWIDLTIFAVSVIIGQLVSYRIMKAETLPGCYRISGLIMLVVMLAAFAMLTYFAPHFILFKEPINGTYGIT